MKSSDEVLFLFEGSHALDNDRVQDDLRKHPERESGPESRGYWANGRIQ